MIKPKLHVYKVGIAKNLYYSIYVEAESEQQAELALGCAAMSKVATEALLFLVDSVFFLTPRSVCRRPVKP
jgi:hypothetical protein